ncbi:RNA-binding protein 48 [Elysia marginata]|uniref:RNA-binding protein 48 n=1 Tax=Elysia marginata TaxID=1093978 RepID=A0AAV4J5P5_9GAST|nr:RNA-binding protein 48 [Elysia marginata]
MDVPSHHLKQKICTTRPPYREGRHPKAVKVYTVNNESIYLIIQGVPSVGAGSELNKLCSSFGPLGDFKPLDEYPCEDKYTEVYLVKYKKIQSSRFAKRKLDEHSFFGGNLHVFYAPEYESCEETRDKLQDRRQVVAKKIRQQTTVWAQEHQHRQPNARNLESHQASVDTRVPPLPTENMLSLQQATKPGLSSLDQQSETHLQSSNFSTTSGPDLRSSAPKPSTPQSQDSVKSILTAHETSSEEFSQSQSDAQTEPNVFELPLPPKSSQTSHQFQKGYKDWRHYEYSRVPTAHASLPVGYDGRLHIPESATSSISRWSDESQSETNKRKDSLPSQPSQLVVRNYKPQRPVPKFVPRQAVKVATGTATSRQKAVASTKSSIVAGSEDDNLRKNAFRLGSVQGPEEMPGRKRALPTAAQQSVNNTIISIRSKISKVIGEKVGKTATDKK